jgi:hypothetical protein
MAFFSLFMQQLWKWGQVSFLSSVKIVWPEPTEITTTSVISRGHSSDIAH